MFRRHTVFVSMLAAALAGSVVLSIASHHRGSAPPAILDLGPDEAKPVPIDPRGADLRGKEPHLHLRPQAIPSNPSSPQRPQPIELRGPIDAEMAAKVSAAISAGHRDFVINSSNGGLVIAAAAMAGLMSGSDATLTANGTCLSACALLLIGVNSHFYVPGADIQIHGAFSKGSPDRDQAVARDAAEFMLANGVPREIAYGPGTGMNMHRLSPAELDSIGIMPAVQIR